MMENKPKITNGPNERARNDTISQTGPGMPDDSSSPIQDVSDQDIERAKAQLTGAEDDDVDEDDEDVPATFVDCEVNLLSLNPLLGILRIDTDMGAMDVLIDREDAGILAGTLVEVLAVSDEDEEDEDEDQEEEDGRDKAGPA